MSHASTDRIRDIVGRLPTTRDEDWKYTDLARARDISARWLDAGAARPSPSLDAEVAAITESIDATWFVFENGVLEKLHEGDGFSAETLGDVPAADSALAELNAALLADGLLASRSGFCLSTAATHPRSPKATWRSRLRHRRRVNSSSFTHLVVQAIITPIRY